MISRRSISIAALKTLVALVWLSLAVHTHCFTQTKASTIDTLMHRLAERGQFNGSVLIAEHGKVIYENGFGKADIVSNIDFTPSTPCYLASLTKQFTAMAVMMLAEEQKLSYSDPLSKYFPRSEERRVGKECRL